MNLDPALALDPGPGGQVGHRLEGVNVFCSAVRIATVVELVGAEEYVSGFDALGQSQGESQENRIPRRDIGNGYVVGYFCCTPPLGNCDLVGERRATNGTEIEIGYPVGFRFEKCRHFLGRLDFQLVALTVPKAQRVKLETLLFGHRGNGGGVESATEENDRVCPDHFCGEVIFVPSTG